MTDNSLSSLYRRLTASRPTAQALSAEDLAAAADGTIAADRRDTAARVLAASSAQASVVRMLRDLQSDSMALAADVAGTERDAGHRRPERSDRRIAADRRGTHVTRWAALAACMVAVIGAWTLRHSATDLATNVVPNQQSVARSDEIFNSRDQIFGEGLDRGRGSHGAKPHGGDHLFHGSFSGG